MNIKSEKKEFSIYRFQFWMQRGFSEEESKLKVSKIQTENSTKRVAKHKPEHSHFNKQYWVVKRGLSEENAIKEVSKLQATLSSRSSKFKGKLRSEESKLKISDSMKRKIALVGGGEWAKHFGEFRGSSKIERTLFNYIKENINPNVEANVPISRYIVDIIDGKKIVELYGDFWHASPRIFESADRIKSYNINKSAEEIWERDRIRIEYLKSNGYSICIIWEWEWNKHKQECVDRLTDFYEIINKKNTGND